MKIALKIINDMSSIAREHRYSIRFPILKQFLSDFDSLRRDLFHKMSDASPDYDFTAGNNYKWKMIKVKKG